MQPGDRLTLTIDKPVAGGRMIARHEGAVVLVSGAIPGETVVAVVEKIQRGTVWAATRRVVTPSPDRIDPGRDGACGGSVYAHVAYPRQLALKRAVIEDAFARIARLPLETPVAVAPSPIDGYRLRRVLHYRGGRLGFFREGTHELCDPAPTRQLTPEAVAAMAELAGALSAVPRAGATEVELSENVPGTERAVHVALAADGDPSGLAGVLPIGGLTGVSAGPPASLRSLTIAGDPTVSDTLAVDDAAGRRASVRLARHARAFFQGNRYLLDTVVSRVARAVPDGAVVDLYAGVGLFAVSLAALGRGPVTAVEGDSIAARDLARNAAALGEAVSVRREPVERFLSTGRLRAGATLIVDPPRTGMSKAALAGIVGLGAPRVVYVSCDVATLARDARVLVDAGYRLAGIEAFDLFPTTAHVETLVVFARG